MEDIGNLRLQILEEFSNMKSSFLTEVKSFKNDFLQSCVKHSASEQVNKSSTNEISEVYKPTTRNKDKIITEDHNKNFRITQKQQTIQI